MCESRDPFRDITKVRNIIFDMDGTLVDTSKATVPTCQKCAVEFGFPVLHPDTITQMIGWANPEFYYRLYPDICKEQVDRYGEEVEIREAAYLKELGREILFPGILDLLLTLKLKGYYLAVASTGSPEHVEISLRAAEIMELFDVIRCGESIKIQMVADIMKGGIEGDWLIVGDKDKDAIAGKSNNICTVGAGYGFGTEVDMMDFEIVIEHPVELIALLKNNNPDSNVIRKEKRRK